MIYSGNLLSNGDASDGLSDWVATNVSTLSDGYDGDCFVLGDNASMKQVLLERDFGAQSANFRLTVIFKLGTEQTEMDNRLIGIIEMVYEYDNNTKDVFAIPCMTGVPFEGRTLDNGWIKVVTNNPKAEGVNIDNIKFSVTTIESGIPLHISSLVLNKDTGVDDEAIKAATEVMKDLTMFNLLLNSRGDDGFSYWVSRGFDIDPTAGVTGKAAFVATGEFGQEKTLSQTVETANRPYYTVSAQVELQDIDLGPNGEVAMDIIFVYEDGTEEIQTASIEEGLL